MSKRAVFVVAQKGGVGKSFFTRGVVQLCRDAGLRTAAFDADGPVGQLMQYYGRYDEAEEPVQDPIGAAGCFDVRDEKQRDGLLQAIATGADVVIIDMPGGSIGEIAKVLGSPQALFDEYRNHGYEVTVAIVISVLKASINSVLDAVDLFGSSVNYVVVKNRGTGGSPEPEDFRVYDGYDNGVTSSEGLARKAIEAHGGQTIIMDEIQASTIQWLDEFDYSFAQGREDKGWGHPHRIKVWLNNLKQALSGGPLAVPEKSESIAS